MARRLKAEHRLLYKRLAATFLSVSDDEEDQLLGILLLLKSRRHQSVRGPYDRVKSFDFCQKLLHCYTDRWFKAHLR